MGASWDETIAAVSSPLGPAARGIVRISGPEAWIAVARVVASPDLADRPPPSEATVMPVLLRPAEIRHAWPGEIFYWPEGRSYTGQTCVEIHTWGSPVLLEACLAGMQVRLARPGEFTLRAFLAGRIDLVQAEAVAAVIAAGNDEELAASLRQLAGGIRRPLQAIREDLIDLLADIEAGLDFAEEDISFLPRNEAERRVREAQDELRRILVRLRSREDARRSYRVVLCGRPNAGKSSLFNAILEGEKAIVSELPGTTRDYLAVETEHRGIPLTLIDTAGEEEFAALESQHSAVPKLLPPDVVRHVEASPRGDALSAAAARSAWETIRAADLIVFCTDCRWELTDQERRFLAAVRRRCLVAATKCDLAGASDTSHADVRTSAASREGVDHLREMIVTRLTEPGTTRDELPPSGPHAQQCVLSAISALDEALKRLGESLEEEYVALAVRAALEALGEIVGAVYTEDILDRIFSRFCIGK